MNSVKWLEGIIFFLFAAFAIIPLSWKQCVKAALFLVIFEGAVRKWFLPSLSQFVYFGKDALILAAYLKYLTTTKTTLRYMPRDPLLVFFAVAASTVILLQAGNVNLGSPIIGIMGARNYVLYLPLLFILQNLFENEYELSTFLKRYLPLSIPVCILAFVQHFSPQDSALNVYVSEDTAKAMVGRSVRSTGTFSYIAGYSAYLQTVAALTLPFMVLKQSSVSSWVYRLTFASVILGLLFSGSRGPVVVLALFLLGYLVFNQTFRALGLYKIFIIPVIICGVAIPIYLSDTLLSFGSRFLSNQDVGMRALASFTTPIDYIMYSGVFGFGSGATYQANIRIGQLLGLDPGTKIPVFYESEPERVMLELGPVGFFLWYAFRFRIILLLWSTYKKLRSPLLRELALVAFLIHLVSISGQVVFQITFTVYYWFMAGFIYLLPKLEQNYKESLFRERVPFGSVKAITRID